LGGDHFWSDYCFHNVGMSMFWCTRFYDYACL